jgi:hypothetical protein
MIPETVTIASSPLAISDSKRDIQSIIEMAFRLHADPDSLAATKLRWNMIEAILIPIEAAIGRIAWPFSWRAEDDRSLLEEANEDGDKEAVLQRAIEYLGVLDRARNGQ